MRKSVWFNIHTRIADDRFVPDSRDESISLIIAATDLPCCFASAYRTSMNSGSSVMLVWCPHKEMDIFFMLL